MQNRLHTLDTELTGHPKDLAASIASLFFAHRARSENSCPVNIGPSAKHAAGLQSLGVTQSRAEARRENSWHAAMFPISAAFFALFRFALYSETLCAFIVCSLWFGIAPLRWVVYTLGRCAASRGAAKKNEKTFTPTQKASNLTH